jgi:hypothetical protein|tara:strand:+ start:4049 stop:4573 length:525 start_codon:yes stop_codon:yes gene_type:complete
MAPLAIAASAATTVVSTLGYMGAANAAETEGAYNKKIYNYRADITERDAELINEQNRINQIKFDRIARSQAAYTNVAYLKNGIVLDDGDPTSTPQKVIKNNAELVAFEKKVMDYNAAIGVKKQMDAAVFERMQGDVANMTARNQALGYKYQAGASLLGGAATTGQLWNKYYKNG